jgi:prolyl-tRNA synthetase
MKDNALRFSKAFIPTTKETPNDAVLASHIYLSRAGFISQVASGLYNFLPLGQRVIENIKTIVRQEMESIGAQEVNLSFATPASLWEESGRLEKFGKELLRFKDRKDNDFVLGPTHEEMMVNLIRHQISSYKHLPLNLYQITSKFRDEARPRFG